jgi:F0F1-type ATP synthase assembly protein I
MNRLAAIIIPPAMGGIADCRGAGPSFVILGTILIGLCAPAALITRRAARTVANQPESTLSD